MNRIIAYFLHNRILSAFVLIAIVLGGLSTAPFNWHGGLVPRNPVAVDAIPDIGDNQQIISTELMGRSPKDMQDQVTYPLTTALMGIPGVKTIRSSSMMGMSFIYIIFNEGVDFYWSRSRILEKLNSLPAGLLPEGVKPQLGPDATALGQIFWYTLEGRDTKTGRPAGGWNPEELRTLQDYYVRYQLSSAEGVSEVASVGGFVKEYQVDLDPEAMRAYGINLVQVMQAVKNSNIDVGAGTMEINRAEYIIRGLGYVKKLDDLENAPVTSREGIPVRVKDLARVSFGRRASPYFTLKANTSGTVVEKNVSPGDYVKQGQPLLKIANLGRVWVMFQAYEADLPFIHKGAEVQFTYEAMPGKTFRGRVSFVDPVLDGASRTAGVRVEMGNAGGVFKPEMNVSGIVASHLPQYSDDIVVPKSAVLWTGTRSVVYVKEEDGGMPVFHLREVTLGPSLPDGYVITDGLAEGEEIVTNGAFAIDASAQLDGKRSMMNR